MHPNIMTVEIFVIFIICLFFTISWMTDAMNITIHIATIYNGECQIIKSTKTISVTAVLIELNTLSLFIVVYYCFGSIIRIIDFHFLSTSYANWNAMENRGLVP